MHTMTQEEEDRVVQAMKDAETWDAVKDDLRDLFLDVNNGDLSDKEKIARVHKFFEPWIEDLYPAEGSPAPSEGGS